MAQKKDFYSLLGVSKNAGDDELKKAYRKLAMQYHPDRNKDNAEAEARFKEINEAYDVLKDPQKRAAYDRFGHAAFEGGRGNAGAGQANFEDIMRGFGGGFGGGAEGGFGNVFDDILNAFGAGGPQGRRADSPQRGSDLRYNLSLDLEDAYLGKTVKIKIPRLETCDTCHGSGAKPGTQPKTCQTCHGSGQVQYRQGFFSVSRTCPTCHGTGKVIPDPCTACHGQGRVQQQQTLNVTIPKGVDNDTRIRLSGEGEAGLNGGPHGDLYVFITVRDHTDYQREGPHLQRVATLSIADAVLGTELELTHLDGSPFKVTIPAGTQPGQQIKLKGKGMPMVNSGQVGDLYIEAKVSIPTKLSAAERAVFEQLRHGPAPETDKPSGGFFKKILGE